MTTNTDIVEVLLEAYNNMGTASREDLKTAADEIVSLRDRITVGNAVASAVVKDLAEATGQTAAEIVAKYHWNSE